MWPWLAASLATHGIAFGALVVAASHSPPDLLAGLGRPDGVVLVSLLDVSATSSRNVLAPGDPMPGKRATIERQPAQAPPPHLARASSRPEPRRTLPRPRRSSQARRVPGTPEPAPGGEPAPTRTEPPVEVAEGETSPSPAPDPVVEGAGHSPALRLASGSPPPRSVSVGLSGSTRAGGSSSGYETRGLDRLARPAAPIKPHYPPQARQRGDEGDVLLDVWVGSAGEADQVAVARSAGDEFDQAAVVAVRSARFHPALRDGQRVPSRLALRLHFQLEQ